MTNKRFISVFITMFLLFIAVFGNAGCGSGGSSPSNNRESTPEPTPVVYYTVTFDSQGGSSVPSQRVKSGDTVIKPGDPIRDGYSFAGWYKSANGTTQFNFGSGGEKVTGDITLYAKWNEDQTPGTYYTVIFDSNGGSSVPSQRVMAGGTVTRPADPVKEGCTFNGWFLANKQFKFGNDGDKVTENITLYAKWIETTPAPSGYTVTFNSNGGSAVESIHASSDGTVNMPENPTKEGYVFAGWFKDEAFTEIFTFGAEGDKITANITLYAQWLDPDLIIAEYAASEISIGYADGDNPNYVTQNLTLQTKIESADISWVSSSGAISANGTVTRRNEDAEVTLTATAMYNGKSAEPKVFNIRVIRRHTRDNSIIEAITIEEASSGDVAVTRNDSGDVTDIEGQYVSFDIRNADDALDAVAVIKDELGVKSPDKELQLNGATINEYGAKYSFGQFYDGLKVWGRRIIVSANSSNQANFLSSNFMSSNAFGNANLNEGITQASAVEIAKENYSDDAECTAKEVIYSFGIYEKSPVRVWIVAISGTQKDGHYADETFFIKSSDGTVISKSNNIVNMTSNYGANEFNKFEQFPVTFEYSPLEFQGFYYMLDTDLNLELFYERLPERLFALNRVRLEPNKLWTDGHQVSAYTNMRRVLQLWKRQFGRNSLDNKGMKVKVITHTNCILGEDGNIRKNNASWDPNHKLIFIDDHNEKRARSCAAALDVLLHESTHAVMNYGIGDEFSMEGDNVAGAINEAYADIFACIMTEDESWRMGEDVFDENASFDCIRNAANPISSKADRAFENTQIPATAIWDALKGALDNSENIWSKHDFSHYISHAAYLMKKNGLSWEELRKLWYQTIHKNVYTPAPKFSDVRREVLFAALTIPSLRPKIRIIQNAFDSAGIYEPVVLRGKVLDAVTYKPIAGVFINARTPSVAYTISDMPYEKHAIADQRYTDSNGNFSLKLGKTKYNINGEYLLGEEDIRFAFPIDLSGDKVITILLSRDGTVSLDSTVPIIPVPESPDVPVPASPDITIDETHFPDRNFREYVKQFDTDSNNILSESELLAVTEISIVRNYVSSLEGIEYFTALQSLYCNINNITSLNLSNNIALQYLGCEVNELTSLNLSNNTALQGLNCNSNRLTSLNLSNNTALQTLDCSVNQLTSLNLTNNTALQYLDCRYNQLTSLNLSNNTALQTLNCANNGLMSLNLSNNTALQTLDCSVNQLTGLNLSNCTDLRILHCYNNQLTTLDVSNCVPDIRVYHDKGVEVTYPSSSASNGSTAAHAPTSGTHGQASRDQNIIAELPEFTPNITGIYSFDISLDHMPPEDSSLVLLADSEDLNGSFAFTESPDVLRVSAKFTAGRTYAPVIVAKTEQHEQFGGCNSGLLGMVMLMAVLLRKCRS